LREIDATRGSTRMGHVSKITANYLKLSWKSTTYVSAAVDFKHHRNRFLVIGWCLGNSNSFFYFFQSNPVQFTPIDPNPVQFFGVDSAQTTWHWRFFTTGPHFKEHILHHITHI
jgi:hypothetical protein